MTNQLEGTPVTVSSPPDIMSIQDTCRNTSKFEKDYVTWRPGKHPFHCSDESLSESTLLSPCSLFSGAERVAVSGVSSSAMYYSIQNRTFTVLGRSQGIQDRFKHRFRLIARGVWLLEGIRGSRQGEMIGFNRGYGYFRHQFSCKSWSRNGRGWEMWLDGYAEGQTAQVGPTHLSAGNTKRLTKEPPTCPGTQDRSSRSIIDPKMVDLEPSVRFDLAPKLDLE